VFSLKPESVFSLFQNRCSDWSRMGVQVEPEYARSPTAFLACRLNSLRLSASSIKFEAKSVTIGLQWADENT